MDVTGGGLKPYEMQTAQAALAYVVGEASAEEAFSGPAPHYPSWRQPRTSAPVIYTSAGPNTDALLGGLGARVGRFHPREVAVQQEPSTCPPGVQWTAAPGSADHREAST